MSQRVLVFESDAAFAKEVKQNLERMGLDVDVAVDGPAGLELAWTFQWVGQRLKKVSRK